MADFYATLYVGNVDKNIFYEWLDSLKCGSLSLDSDGGYLRDKWDFCINIEGCCGGRFWESLALEMVSKFEGIVFDGEMSAAFDDHIMTTTFTCDGAKISLGRGVLSHDYYYGDESCGLWELEYDAPYSVKFSVDEVGPCMEIYKKASKKIKDVSFVKSVCDEYNVPIDRAMQFASIYDLENSKEYLAVCEEIYFAQMDILKYSFLENGDCAAEIVKLVEEIVIPKEYEGAKVVSVSCPPNPRRHNTLNTLKKVVIEGETAIAEHTFSRCSNLAEVSALHITSIGDEAFSWCRSLESISIPESVTSIGEGAFKSCESLKSISIPKSVTSIGDEAFSWCRSLKSISIPESVTSIGKGAFSWCRSLKSISIPKSVTSIGDEAFSWCRSLESISIPESVTSIGKGAFKSCESLKSISIPKSVTSIGEGAFSGCNSLKSILIPEGVTSICDSAFSDFGSLESISIPDGVTSIGKEAFYGCGSLKSISLPKSVTSIGKGAFSGCNSLKSINIPENITSIGKEVFHGCNSLESIEVAKENKTYHSVNNCIIKTKSKTLVAGCKNSIIPDDGSVTKIEGGAFSGCYYLKSISIPEMVNKIGDKAFCDCSSLKSITIPESVTSIGKGAFEWCSSLKSITIPESVTSIGNKAFYGCDSLKSITIPESVTSIGNEAFSSCGLKSITIPESVTSIGNKVFEWCGKVTIFTTSGSYANKYAKEHGIKVKLI